MALNMDNQHELFTQIKQPTGKLAPNISKPLQGGHYLQE
jgi:hypothetical protein